jgi:hypothetical protein
MLFCRIFDGDSASGVTVNCNGAKIKWAAANSDNQEMIFVQSRQDKDTEGKKIWKRPENIIIKNCQITGSVGIHGMTGLYYPSRREGYVETARNNAPKNITLDSVTITGTGQNILYI